MSLSLECLPNKTIEQIIEKLALKDRLRMAQVSRKFRGLVDVGVLPITDSVHIDMVNELLDVTAYGKGVYKLINEKQPENAKSLERRTNRTQKERNCERLLFPEMLVRCLSGQWSGAVEKYLTSMRNNYRQKLSTFTSLGSCDIIVPETGDIEILPSLFGVKFKSVTLQQSPPSGHPLFPVPGAGEYEWVKRGQLPLHFYSVRQLPENVYKWIETTTATSFSTNYALPPSLLDRIPCENVEAWLTLEGAAHLLERFNEGLLKRAKNWLFLVVGDPKEVWENLVDRYGEHGDVHPTSMAFPKTAYKELKLLVSLPIPDSPCNCVNIEIEYQSDELEDLEALAEIQEMLPEEKRKKKGVSFVRSVHKKPKLSDDDHSETNRISFAEYMTFFGLDRQQLRLNK